MNCLLLSPSFQEHEPAAEEQQIRTDLIVQTHGFNQRLVLSIQQPHFDALLDRGASFLRKQNIVPHSSGERSAPALKRTSHWACKPPRCLVQTCHDPLMSVHLLDLGDVFATSVVFTGFHNKSFCSKGDFEGRVQESLKLVSKSEKIDGASLWCGSRALLHVFFCCF